MRVIKIISLILAFGLLLLSVNAQEQKPELVVQAGHTQGVDSIVFSPDDSFLVSGGSNGVVIWNVDNGTSIRTIESELTNGIVSMSRSGKVLFNSKLWSIQTGEIIKTVKMSLLTLDDTLVGFDYTKVLSEGINLSITDIETGQVRLIPVDKNHSPQLLTVSLDGTTVASASNSGIGKQIIVWNLKTGKLISTIKGHKFDAGAIALSPDGKTLASRNDFEVKIWDVETGNLKKDIKTDYTGVFRHGGESLAFSADGKNLAVGFQEKTIIVDSASGQLLHTLDYPSDVVSFSSNSKILAAGYYNEIRLWNVDTGQLLREMKAQITVPKGFAFSTDGKALAVGSWIGRILLWQYGIGKEPVILKKESEAKRRLPVSQILFSPNSDLLASAAGFDEEGELDVWEAETGKKLYKFRTDQISSIKNISFGLESKTLLAWQYSQQPINVAIGNRIKLFDSYSGNEQNKLSAELLKKVDSVSKLLDQTLFVSPVGNTVAIANYAKKEDGYLVDGDIQSIEIWDANTSTKTGEINKTSLQDVKTDINSAKFMFSPDGQKFLGAFDKEKGAEFRIWNIKGDLQNVIPISGDSISNDPNVVLSPDGKFLAVRLKRYTSGNDIYETILLDTESKKEIQVIKEADSARFGVMLFNPDSKFLFIEGSNGVINVIDSSNGNKIAKLVFINDKDWLVVTPDGLFDGSPAAWKQLIWRFDNNTFNYAPVESFFKEYYYPGLLQEIVQGKTPRPPNKDLSQVDIRQPQLKISEIDGKQTDSQLDISTNKAIIKVKVEITDNTDKPRKDHFPASGGAADVRLFRNGSLVRLWEKNAFELTEKDGCRQIPATKENPRKAVCETTVQITADRNVFTAYAFNHDDVKSTDAAAEIKGADSLKRKGKLQILAVGVNQYANRSKNLKFAVPDAVDFAAELRKQQIKLDNYDAPEIVQLIDAEATKRNILNALERFAKGDGAKQPENFPAELKTRFAAVEKTQPEDVLVIYFAGHGTARCGYDEKTKQTNCDRFFLIPHDGFPTNAPDEATRLKLLHENSISDLELEAVLRDLDAGELMLVVDACNSGQALEAEEKRRGPMNSRGLAQLAFEKGMYILTAAQSYQAALEVSRTPEGKRIEHGLLTYSLLEGLTSPLADADSNKSVTEREWLAYAVEAVPRIQLEEMKMRSAGGNETKSEAKKRADIVFLDGDDVNLPPEKRTLQTPRVFYRRETAAKPFVVAK